MTGEDRYTDWDAAYVLGALSPPERREFERHLAGCTACREAVTELAGMPAVLSELSPDQGVALAPDQGDGAGPSGGDVVSIASLAAAARRRRRRRSLWQGAAALALVAAGGLGGSVLSSTGSDTESTDDQAITLDPVDGSNVTADLTLTPSAWGTRMEWSCSYPSSGASGGPAPTYPSVYELVLVGADGSRTVVATWTGDGDDHASGLLASSAVPVEDITRIELGVEDADRVLAAAELGDA
ncbi:MAG TPA: zf-HC2 domain-containing protein [Candidatus Ruania gallistercoris]|uniref:Zf-HC2 domain-containing protein n=1 Tax=Candidatus Ruania gallistercoris TaxID=2838746 RepID=A0A9D2EI39_9MICO|nr:zf-HC2 domain-containing protein [Candidatus Ruania gallistercoris]